MIPAGILRAIGIKGAVALVALAVAGVLYLRLQWVEAGARHAEARLETVKVERDAERRRTATLADEVRQGQQTAAELARVNGTLQQGIVEQRKAMAALKAEAARLDELAEARQRKVLEAAHAARELDRARRARADLPPPDEYDRVLREVVGAL